jgi:hypothetical protein
MRGVARCRSRRSLAVLLVPRCLLREPWGGSHRTIAMRLDKPSDSTHHEESPSKDTPHTPKPTGGNVMACARRSLQEMAAHAVASLGLQ